MGCSVISSNYTNIITCQHEYVNLKCSSQVFSHRNIPCSQTWLFAQKNSGNCWDQNQLSWWLRADWKWFGHVDCKNDGQLVTGKWHQIFCQLVQEFWSMTTTYISHSHWVVALTTVMCYTMHRITINTEREQIRLIYILWTQGWCARDSTFAPSPQTYTTAAFREGQVREGANVGVCQSAAAAVVVGGVFVCTGTAP